MVQIEGRRGHEVLVFEMVVGWGEESSVVRLEGRMEKRKK